LDSKKVVGYDSLEEGLKRYLSPDMVNSILRDVQATNNEIVENDLMRRSAPPATAPKGAHVSNTTEPGTIQYEIGLEVFEQLTESVASSELIQNVLIRLANIEEALEKQQLKYENQILRLNQEVANLQKSDDEKYTARINNIPAVKKHVFTLANNGGVSRGYQVQQKTNSELDFEQRIQASKAATNAVMAKGMGVK
jgi:hypothetical protein